MTEKLVDILSDRITALEKRVEAVEDRPALEPLRELECHPALGELSRELARHTGPELAVIDPKTQTELLESAGQVSSFPLRKK